MIGDNSVITHKMRNKLEWAAANWIRVHDYGRRILLQLIDNKYAKYFTSFAVSSLSSSSSSVRWCSGFAACCIPLIIRDSLLRMPKDFIPISFKSSSVSVGNKARSISLSENGNKRFNFKKHVHTSEISQGMWLKQRNLSH